MLDSQKLNNAWLALALGGAGFLLNMSEVDLGWGAHLMFGNAVIYAFLRIMDRKYLVSAISIASARTILLWNQPWAWLVWTIEAAFVATFTRKASPVRNDLIFWLLIGAPLLLLSYGFIMKMDLLSLRLVIAKQAMNGMINIVIGETLYFFVLNLPSRFPLNTWPKMPINSFITMILSAVVLVPATAYLSIDAPQREKAVNAAIDHALQERLQGANATLSIWATSRSLELKLYVEQKLAGSTSTPVSPPNLAAEFKAIGILSKDGSANWLPQGDARLIRRAIQDQIKDGITADSPYRILTLPSPQMEGRPELVLVVPYITPKRDLIIVARLQDSAFRSALRSNTDKPIDGMFLVNPKGIVLPLSSAKIEQIDKIRDLASRTYNPALKAVVTYGVVSYGNSYMNDVRNAVMIRATGITTLPNWQIYALSAVSSEVLAARKMQLTFANALTAFMALIIVVSALLSKQLERSLRQIAQSAADLAHLGTRHEKIDSLVILELNEISSKIASADSKVTKDYGALASYQRRLSNISKHAPILVYAVEVIDGKQGDIIYVSEALERLFGYTQAEAFAPGWWLNAIHPEDQANCIAELKNLAPGKVINLEYRMRHKEGHYIWVYNTIAVDANPETKKLEAIGVVKDISVRKAAAAQLLQTDKMASLGRMILGTAHELNQPLNFIKIAASNMREYARRGILNADRAMAKLDGILTQVDRAAAIILQMRVFNRIPQEAPIVLDIKNEIDAVVTMVLKDSSQEP